MELEPGFLLEVIIRYFNNCIEFHSSTVLVLFQTNIIRKDRYKVHRKTFSNSEIRI
jgi:hypothetical protein